MDPEKMVQNGGGTQSPYARDAWRARTHARNGRTLKFLRRTPKLLNTIGAIERRGQVCDVDGGNDVEDDGNGNGYSTMTSMTMSAIMREVVDPGLFFLSGWLHFCTLCTCVSFYVFARVYVSLFLCIFMFLCVYACYGYMRVTDICACSFFSIFQ